MKLHQVLVLAGFVLGLSLGAAQAASLTDAEKCGAKKGKTLIKYAKCLDKAYDKYYSSNELFPSTEKLAKCDAKCTKGMESAEKKGLCATNTDSTDPDVCGPNSIISDEADCRYRSLHFGSCTYPPP